MRFPRAAKLPEIDDIEESDSENEDAAGADANNSDHIEAALSSDEDLELLYDTSFENEEDERKETLRIACRQFKEACSSFDSVAVIMIDKDFTELSVLKEEFPSARILLYPFHVVKYLQEEVAKEKYNLDAWTKKEMKRLIQLLVSAPTEVVYDNVITAMKVVIRTEEKQQLWFRYFDANWTECKERWSSVYRGNVPHMGNHTNNRLESSWQKLKTLVNRSTSLDDYC
ncbi:hypothetical protein PPTG_11948 [Phytophthora nicotianae INRA-310]|uniref:ZSWIM1/3 RNaseH-like domain-containing protein n=1 Tax=Phytophthora nicotianae (strain INRA-310) TaxID=761204 RepID=W2Q8W6_PHYN3|nr:hypothetical protein PPTG_11948 [Phytophthora nicotianae INRA-310]ETN09618.1 hypothetical protein PPTG_11948 [Phytophthora nicotianae INRA-310]